MTEATCQHCGDELQARRRGPGRPRRFCSGRCRTAAFRAGRLPAEMTGRTAWTRADGKRPIRPDGSPASTTDPETWSPYGEVQHGAGDGLGVMLGAGLGCYDLDHVDDEQARAFIATIPERIIWTERSMSGDGVHVFVAADEARGWKRTIDGMSVERYSRARFVRVTGKRFG